MQSFKYYHNQKLYLHVSKISALKEISDSKVIIGKCPMILFLKGNSFLTFFTIVMFNPGCLSSVFL